MVPGIIYSLNGSSKPEVILSSPSLIEKNINIREKASKDIKENKNKKLDSFKEEIQEDFVLSNFERDKIIDKIIDRSGVYQIFEGTKKVIITFLEKT